MGKQVSQTKSYSIHSESKSALSMFFEVYVDPVDDIAASRMALKAADQSAESKKDWVGGDSPVILVKSIVFTSS